jgi:S-adenosylmethionine decarboxylase
MVVPFSPQGITACAIVSESHLALHSWPEKGRLFVDIASCSTREGVLAAVDAIAKAMPEGVLTVLMSASSIRAAQARREQLRSPRERRSST